MSAREPALLTLAHSPDSDDLVMWWPLTGMHGPDGRAIEGELGRPAIESDRFAFRTIAEDIQELNRRAIERADYDITAISAHTYPHVRERYAITSCGGSFGEGYGPKVVVRDDSNVRTTEDLASRNTRIGVPGMNTTAMLVFGLMMRRHDADWDPDARCAPMRFDTIVSSVLDEETDAGLLIHEEQLLAEDRGLRVIADLGQWWAEHGAGPLPLGLNVIKRDLDERFGPGAMAEVASLLTASIRLARERASDSRHFLLLHAEDRPEWRDDALVDEYLARYVSASAADMGDAGAGAIQDLLIRGAEAGLSPHPGEVDVIRT